MVAFMLPAAVALVVAVCSRPLERRLEPGVATVALTGLATLSASAVVASVALVALAFLSSIPGVDRVLGWCEDLYPSHANVPPWQSAAAVPVLTAMVASAARTRRRFDDVLRSPHRPPGPLDVVRDERALAFAVPGRPGHVVVSTGMLRALDADERRALLAHERAHLERRHDRYLRTTMIAASAVPLLRPLLRDVRVATERWADEDAAAAVGDRRLVARAIARAALATSAGPAGSLQAATMAVEARLHALMAPRDPISAMTVALLVAGGSAVAVVALGSFVQVHHVVAFVAHVCGV